MPKVVGNTPPWLSRPSPGAKLFSDIGTTIASGRQPTTSNRAPENTQRQRTTKLIAHRGSEIFTVVGNSLRWADLAQVKNSWEIHDFKHEKLPQTNEKGNNTTVYRTLKTTVHSQFTDLVISPSGHFLAICTNHAVHIAVLPNPLRLHDQDRSDIKLKTHQLGPTTHVVPEAPLAAVLWHPLAAATPSADCLITVTTDAAVRLWEIDRTSHWSFDRPALAIDLRKLADGTSSEQDFEPLTFGKKHGFTADTFDMEASAASFGGHAQESEDPWASMTLWTAMTNGDLYALCPILPSKWLPTNTTVPALTTSTVSEKATIQSEDLDDDGRRAVDQRYEWACEIDNEDDLAEDLMRLRPQHPSAIPRLQGPFELPSSITDKDVEVSDIFIMPRSLDEEDVFSGEDDYDFIQGSKILPFTVVCVATEDCGVHILVDLDGVTGQWLPRRGRSTFSVPIAESGDFVLVESIQLPTSKDSETTWPRFTRNPASPYTLFVTAGSGVFSLSLEGWVSRLGFEVTGEDEPDQGLQTRLAVACQGSIGVLKELISQEKSQEGQRKIFTAVAFVENADTSTILLTCANGEASAIQLDRDPMRVSQMITRDADGITNSPFRQSLKKVLNKANDEVVESLPTRAPYAPDSVFYQNQMLPYEELKSKLPPHRKHLLTDQPIKLSPACLDLMTATHRTFSHQTADIEKAAAELFRRCERLREELAEQVRQMSEMADRMQGLRYKDGDDERRKVPLNERISQAHTKQKDLVTRYENVRRKAGRVGNKARDLSTQEINWIQEIDGLSQHAGIKEDVQDAGKFAGSLDERYHAVKELAQELLAQAGKLTPEQATDSATVTSTTSQLAQHRSPFSLSSRVQRERAAEAMAMVDRESAIIDAVMSRLDRLNVS